MIQKIEHMEPNSAFLALKELFVPRRPYPEAVYYNGLTTICVFPDGSKITARPMDGDVFDKATGVAMCIAKYVCGSRGRFHALVESGDDQTPELRGNAD